MRPSERPHAIIEFEEAKQVVPKEVEEEEEEDKEEEISVLSLLRLSTTSRATSIKHKEAGAKATIA